MSQHGHYRTWRTAGLLCLAALVAVGLWSVWHWQYTQAAQEAERHAQNRLALYSSSLRGALERFAYLPGLLAQQTLVQAALTDEVGILATQANGYLSLVAERSGAEAIFLMDAQGITIAASNHADDDSFLGHHYTFRPYFRDAMANGKGEFFAIGSTTGRPGYFVSAAVDNAASTRPQGVLALKISLESLQESWRQAGENVLLSDANGVVILSSRPEWRYRRLAELSSQALREIREQRQFMDEPLEPLGDRLRDGTLSIGHQGIGERYLDMPLELATLGWTMHYLVPVRPLYASARNALLAAAGGTLALLLLALWLRERQKRQRLRERESRIILEANERLEARVEERTRELQEAQAELVQAGKLAALGTMAAGIAHELNQPLSGIRTYAANGERLLSRDRTQAAEENFRRIQDLCERLGTLIRQLKLFARKGGAREPVNLTARLDFVLELLEERIQRQGVTLHVALPAHSSPDAIRVAGDEVRIEQLLTNLLRNALDALRGVETPCLEIVLEDETQRWVITVADNGPGIDEATLAQLFDPFYTTKAVGDGLGLGLFISYGIVQDLGGRITAGNREAGGAWFRVELPKAEGDPRHAR
ncbi:two-component sensor histidine kinase [Litchfieldella qijiaojingensis]|uniref:histidine kinase n=1 Tax=Litchfieldella qijiaojingensis TaxID=980347 RepID=A0ABQ2Z9L6_9GAMM|nr:ATP-binding protein [Halomonas qijiaojingensis]GGY09482.1 two-component sensor histidine kinase [Halomonas qijiaojingensis]